MTTPRTLVTIRPAAAVGIACAALACAPHRAITSGPTPADQLPESTLRRGVAASIPAAFTGSLGPRPMVWILADGRDSVLRAAIGRDRLAHDSTGAEVVTWTTAAEMLPGTPASASPGDLLEWGRLATGRDTVDVIWVRVASAVATSGSARD